MPGVFNGEGATGPIVRSTHHRAGTKGRVVDTYFAVTAPGQAKAPTTPTDIKTFHCTYCQTHEVLLMETADQQGVHLRGELHECRGCSMVKGLREPIVRSTHNRAGTLCPSRAPAVITSYCRKGGVYSRGGRERGGHVSVDIAF